jgi:hypothetical protein
MVSCSVMVDSSGWSGFSSIVDIVSICGVAASSATFNARSTACLSGESCIGVCGEPRGVKVGDTASSSIRVARSTLCSMERDEVDWIAAKSSGLSPARLRRWSVIVSIDVDRIEGRIRLILMCLCRFRSV